MIIEDAERLRLWLTAILQPLCDADPAALAKYVLALIKKDKPEKELRQSMSDQLDVFLQHDQPVQESRRLTVIRLQNEVDNKNTKELCERLSRVSISFEEANASTSTTTSSAATATSATEETPKFVEKLFELLKTREYVNKPPPAMVVKEPPVRVEESTPETMDSQDEESLMIASGSSVGSFSNSTDSSYTGPAYVPSKIAVTLAVSSSSQVEPTEATANVTSTNSSSPSKDSSELKSATKKDRKDDDRERSRRAKRSRSPRRNVNRPVRSRSRARERRYHPRKNWISTRRRSRSPLRNRSASPARNRSRTPPRYRRHSRTRSRSRSPIELGRNRSPSGNTLRDKSEKKEGLLPAPMNLDERTPEGGLKDVGEKPSIQSVIVKAGSSSDKPDKGNRCKDFDEKGLCMRGELCPFDHGSDPVVLEDVVIPGVTTGNSLQFNNALTSGGYSSVAAPSMLRPPLPVMGEYYPDNPGMDPNAAWGSQQSFRPRGMGFDPILRGRGDMMPRGPPPMGPFPISPQRQLISVPVMGMPRMGEPQGPLNLSPHSMRGMHMGMGRGRGRGGFDHSRLGFKSARNYYNCSLEVKKIPREQNNIMDLNSHFQKFGKIVNIQINFENDPEAALVTFSSPNEAQSAYRSTEAVLNNRFVRVFWHNKEKENEERMEVTEAPRTSVKDRLGGHESEEKQEQQEKILVSGNSLVKTVYNPAMLASKKTENAAAEKVQAVEAIKKSQEMLAAQESLKKKQQEKKKETLKLISDLRKRKQEMLAENIEHQKKLISKLESGKGTMTPAEKDNLMKVIKSVQNQIEKIKKELEDDGPNLKAQAALATPKSKEEAQREMLDAELELYNKEQEGGDTQALEQKISDLRAKARALGMPYRGRGAFRGSPRGYGGIRGGRGRGRGGRQTFRALRSVDRRPTKLQVSGFPQARLPEILPHFSQFGTITEYETNHETPCMTLNFDSRKSAEMAVSNGMMFGDVTLSFKWISNGRSDGGNIEGMSNSKNGDASHLDDEMENGASIEDDELGDILANEILLTYEDDDEDDDDRSWRR